MPSPGGLNVADFVRGVWFVGLLGFLGWRVGEGLVFLHQQEPSEMKSLDWLALSREWRNEALHCRYSGGETFPHSLRTSRGHFYILIINNSYYQPQTSCTMIFGKSLKITWINTIKCASRLIPSKSWESNSMTPTVKARQLKKYMQNAFELTDFLSHELRIDYLSLAIYHYRSITWLVLYDLLFVNLQDLGCYTHCVGNVCKTFFESRSILSARDCEKKSWEDLLLKGVYLAILVTFLGWWKRDPFGIVKWPPTGE